MSMLFIVSTPIGNLEDITLRALRVLKEVDAVVCEDTRHTRILLDHYEVKKPMYSFHERSSDKDLKFIVSLLESGKNLAYVTDAGTPGIADPGNRLVAEIAKLHPERSVAKSKGYVSEVLRQAQEVNIVSIPGPSSLTAAISICGFNMQEFRFFGFLPHKKGRQTKIKEIIESDVPVVLFESKYRIQRLFDELLEFGATTDHSNDRSLSLRGSAKQSRSIARHPEIASSQSLLAMTPMEEKSRSHNFLDHQCIVCNDLTKKFERVYRGTVEMVGKEIAASEPKGEFVIIIR